MFRVGSHLESRINWGPQMEEWLEKSKVWCRCLGSKWESVVEKANIVGQEEMLLGKQADERGK